MGPKKGGAVKKEDEAEIAARKKEAQIKSNSVLKFKMETEAKNSRINNFKILNQWRKVMRLAKAESLKKDIEILSQNHERDVDRKDAILQMIDRDLEEAEDQYQMTLRSHLVNMDTLIQLHDSRLYALERGFEHELRAVQSGFQKEKDIIVSKFSSERKDLTALIDCIDKDESEREAEAKHAFETLREELRNRNLEDINMLRISLDAQIEELEQHFETAHLNYLQQTAQRTHEFKALTQTDQILTRDIESRTKKIDNLQNTIKQWRAKIRQLGRETEERNRLLLEEKHSIQTHYQQLKQRIHTYRGTQNQRLLQLSECANKCKLKLNEKLDLARRVLQLSEFCRKLETIQELVLPFETILGSQDGNGGASAAESKQATVSVASVFLVLMFCMCDFAICRSD
jgi:dynein regulatory complex subunit 2